MIPHGVLYLNTVFFFCGHAFLTRLLLCFLGYVQSLIRRVVNNVNIVVNNLILKYVEDDIVLSVNITSAECYTVDDMWERAFMDITGEQWLFTFLGSGITK